MIKESATSLIDSHSDKARKTELALQMMMADRVEMKFFSTFLLNFILPMKDNSLRYAVFIESLLAILDRLRSSVQSWPNGSTKDGKAVSVAHIIKDLRAGFN